MVQFTGEYKQEKQENIDAYLTAVGMPWIARKTAGNITPALEVTKNGDEWTMTWKSTMMSSTAKFTIGVEFVEKNPRGKEIKAIATFENDTLTIITQPENGEVRRILKFTDAGIDMTMLAVKPNVSGKRIFRRI